MAQQTVWEKQGTRPIPVFNFDEGPFSFFSATVPNVSFIMPEESGTVVFTLSASVVNGNVSVTHGGMATPSLLVLDLNAAASDIFTLTAVSGSNSGFSGPISMSFNSIGGTWTLVFTGGTAGPVTRTVTTSSSGLTSPVIGSFAGITFTSSTAFGFLNIATLTANIGCFCGGTMIATPSGEVAVESLQPGDRVLTAEGGQTTVRWLGRQEILPRFAHPAKVNPICISAGSLAEGVPMRDLFVSPDHAVEIDGLLINAMALVNGRSIYQLANMPLDGFTYYHLETEAHELIVAEGCPAESYLDIPDREAFVNAEDRAGAAPIREMDRLRISARRLVPTGIAARLRARADHTVAKPRRAA